METVNLGKLNPATYKSLAAFDATAQQAAVDAGLDPLLIELVRIRASQINGCAYCLRLHSRDAIAKGESADRLAIVAAWWETQYFSDKEQAALILAERLTNISHTPTGGHDTVDVDVVLTATEIAAISWLVIVINAWNRVAISSRYSVTP
ncbi:alkylhydroperoxidase [Microbacterium sp. Root61]|uniref:carboxymuconolactone decarboxylase family protein n=1 Tax=Microbacterium sp. Root61 TaxID=1736570 RepID=UPI0006F8BA7D|nr:carboxymuconolactone decarboxylase family protein [Microbacterium sp. Root61]KRA24838.1 alkylhydroperoxidase [Microbacterium sp. Root61]